MNGTEKERDGTNGNPWESSRSEEKNPTHSPMTKIHPTHTRLRRMEYLIGTLLARCGGLSSNYGQHMNMITYR